MAHARRMFFEAKDNDKVIAEYALEQIGLLYNIERKAKEQQFNPGANIATAPNRSSTRIRVIRQVDERNLPKSIAEERDR